MKVSPLVSKIDQYPKAFYAHDFELADSESEKKKSTLVGKLIFFSLRHGITCVGWFCLVTHKRIP